MREYKVIKEETINDFPKTVVYDSKVKGYQASSSIKALRVVRTSQDEYFRYVAGERKHIFPDFDPKLHIAMESTYQPESNNYENIPVILYEIVNNVQVQIPYGCFHILESQKGPFLKQFSISADGYIDLGRSEYLNIYNDFADFRKQRSLYEQERKRHRSSALLYGPPGNGKTREICQILQNAEKEQFRAIFVTSEIKNLMSLEDFRKPLENEDIIFVIEEVTERTKDKSNTDQLLSFLDGELSWNHSFVIATTNYPELLEHNIVDRPGRFKSVIEVGSPTTAQRHRYLTASGISPAEAERAAELTEGLSIDYLSFITFEHKRTGQPFEKLMKETRENRAKTSKRFRQTLGISGGPC